jgi:hypothetical protein
MNIIELLLRISPDGGNGSTELIIGAVVILIAAALYRSVWLTLKGFLKTPSPESNEASMFFQVASL